MNGATAATGLRPPIRHSEGDLSAWFQATAPHLGQRSLSGNRKGTFCGGCIYLCLGHGNFDIFLSVRAAIGKIESTRQSSFAQSPEAA